MLSPTDPIEAAAEQETIDHTENTLLGDLIERNDFGNPYNPLPPNQYAPNREGGGPVPIGNVAASVSNYLGTKFTRGWLDGSGGADIDMAFGPLIKDITTAPYNCTLFSDFLSQGIVPGLSNVDVNAPGRQASTHNAVSAAAEFIPSTWDSRLNGLDVITGHVGPRVFAAQQPILGAPTDQFAPELQVPAGGVPVAANVGTTGIPFGKKESVTAWKQAPRRGRSNFV